MSNKTYKDWDVAVVQLQSNDSPVVTISMTRQDMEAMSVDYKVNRGDLIDLLIQSAISELGDKNKPIN